MWSSESVKMKHFRVSTLLAACTLSTIALFAQQPGPLPVKAVLLLTPEFCESQIRHGNHRLSEHFNVGKVACSALEPALKNTFLNLTVASDLSASHDFQIVLVPRFVDAGMIMDSNPQIIRQMDVLLEWTVSDSSSAHTLWLETIYGSAKHEYGDKLSAEQDLSGKSVLTSLLENSIRDAAVQSAIKMSAAPELRKITQARH